MSRTPTGLAALVAVDPQRVELPHGCEITLRRSIAFADTLLPMGTIGRVTGHPEAGKVQITIVGRGDLVVPREDIVPRTDGQLRHAVDRARAEAALGPCVLARATVGSRAWGLSDANSDHDTRGVLLWPFPWASARGRVPDVVVSADGSHTLWEVGRTIEQALRADPNTLEMLFVPERDTVDPLAELLFDARDAFVSTRIYGSFGRYAVAQSKKLRQSLRLARHRTDVLTWLRGDPNASLDHIAARLAQEAVSTGGPSSKDEVLRAKQYLKQLYRSMSDQGLIAACSFEALADFARADPTGLDLPRELRPKNAYNLLRIVSCAVQWLRTGVPLIAAQGELRDRLLAIKRGEVDLETALEWTDTVAQELDAAREHSVLPEKPDAARADAVLLQLREEAARRWLAQAPGPWGAQAAPAPRGTDVD